MAIVATLASLALPSFVSYRENAKIAATASEMRSLFSAFVTFESNTDNFPEDSHLTIPAGMDKYISQALWDRGTPIGGRYNWEGPDNYSYAGISIFQSTATDETIQKLDKMLDDGDLTTGRFRTGSNGRPTYIIEAVSYTHLTLPTKA